MTSRNHVIDGSSNFVSWRSPVHHLAMFSSQKFCTSKDQMLLVCHGIKLDHVVKGSGGYKNRSSLRFGGHTHCSSGDVMILVCQVI